MGKNNTTGQIDTTTVYGAISAMTSPSLTNIHPWAWNNGIELLAALINCNNLYIAPVPGELNAPTDLLGDFLRPLDSVCKSLNIPIKIKDSTKRHTNQWIEENIDKIKNEYCNLINNNEDFNKWRNWHIEYAWTENCRRLNGLIDREFDNSVKKVISFFNINEKAFNHIMNRSEKITLFKDIISGKDAEELELAKHIWSISFLIRGIYYNYLTKDMDEQFFFHQARENCLPEDTSDKRIIIELHITEKYIFNILLASVFSEKESENRFKKFAQFVKVGKSKLGNGNKLVKYHRKSKALEEAIDITKKCFNLDINSKLLDTSLEMIHVGVIIMTPFLQLDPWVQSGVILADTGAKKILSKRINTFVSKSRLIDLATAPPGRIIRSKYGKIQVEKE